MLFVSMIHCILFLKYLQICITLAGGIYSLVFHWSKQCGWDLSRSGTAGR